MKENYALGKKSLFLEIVKAIVAFMAFLGKKYFLTIERKGGGKLCSKQFSSHSSSLLRTKAEVKIFHFFALSHTAFLA